MIAGPLIVIDVDTLSSGMPSNSTSMSARLEIATPHLADLALRPRMVGVVAHQRREVEGDGESGLPVREQELVALVRLARAAEAGELAHRPELAAIAGGMDAARVRIRARHAEVRLRAPARRAPCRAARLPSRNS